MNLNLNPEQIAYLKGLDSKEKRKEFLLDCLVENSIGESEKTYGNFDFLKDIANSPRYLLPHEMEEIQRLNPSFTNTTTPRTFENRQEFSTEDYDFEKGIKESIEMRIPNDNKAKYTEEDMNKCFAEGLWIGAEKGSKALIRPDEMFSNYLKKIKND